nr:SDR family NAD(P)-dependent oxidoreductase [Cellulosilyticum ruminicola]
MIKGKEVLPGAAYLEMAYTAIKAGAQNIVGKELDIRLQGINWRYPFTCKEAQRLNIAIGLESNDVLYFEMYEDSNKEELRVYCDGKGIVVPLKEVEKVSIQQIKELHKLEEISASQCYEFFKQNGIAYGNTFKVIQQMYVGEECILARVELAEECMNDFTEYTLHPSLIDGAIHACIGFNIYEGKQQIAIPVSVEAVEIYGDLSTSMWAYITKDTANRCCIKLCDGTGNVKVYLSGLVTKEITSMQQEKVVNTVIKETPVVQKVVKPVDIKEESSKYIKEIIAGVLKMPVEKINDTAQFEEYGIDSVIIMDLTQELEKTFGDLPKTLFFEYQTVNELVTYFVENHKERLNEIVGPKEVTEEVVKVVENTIKPKETAAQNTSNIKVRKRTQAANRTINRNDEAYDIAIIGISGKYPGANNIEELWKELLDGKDCITEIPKERWDYTNYYDANKNTPGKTSSKWGGFLEDVDKFDPLFFNISPRDAGIMDPQERLFLQCAYETIEDAGYTRSSLSKYSKNGLEGNVGVFVGVMYEEYQLYGAQQQAKGNNVTVSGNISSIANRVSYVFNLHGPSIALDTMCSSSLTAIQLACQSIRTNGCEMAIAGGVNLSIHPNKYLSITNFVASDGRCRTFGEGGDGYVPGEGVGAVLLKPLERAIEDNDQIYGVIKSIAINHGGKTNGYTVPNLKAQKNVIDRAIKASGINPRAISYVEAHGTGTALGDPIEIEGLKRSFEAYTSERQYCAIGSIKSNIGHTESASGIAGITKVLLQMKHKKLVPSLHSEVLNPNIEFAQTPFKVQREVQEWKRPIIDQKEAKLIASISSFGAGGSNAYMILEEYIPEHAITTDTKANEKLIVLSAKTEEKLKVVASELKQAISERQLTNNDLSSIAYTLQVGREAKEERVAFTVNSIKDLSNKLDQFIVDEVNEVTLYRGHIKHDSEVTKFIKDSEAKELIGKWIAAGAYSKVLEFWVQGGTVNWEQLYTSIKPVKISLPTYPFEKERFWIVGDQVNNSVGSYQMLHPVVHRNTSNVLEQKYMTSFNGNEFFLADHQIGENSVLPGAVYLEMVYEAVKLAVKEAVKGKYSIKIEEVRWRNPFIAEENHEINIGFSLLSETELSFKIYSVVREDIQKVYCEGKVVLGAKQSSTLIDIEAIKANCKQREMSKQVCYSMFSANGINYGKAHQVVENIQVGNKQLLAKIKLPECLEDTFEEYALHPSLIDGAIHASIGFTDEEYSKLDIPYALDCIKVYQALSKEMWVHTVILDNNKYDITVCNEVGEVSVQIQGLVLKEMPEIKIAGNGTFIYTPSLVPYEQKQSMTKQFTEHLVFIYGTKDKYDLTNLDGKVTYYKVDENEIAKSYEESSIQLFNIVKTKLASHLKADLLVQVVVLKTTPALAMYEGLLGMIKTAQSENSKVHAQLITIEGDVSEREIVEDIKQSALNVEVGKLLYKANRCYTYEWKEENVTSSIQKPWKEKGTYVITGGMGGLGITFAKEIVSSIQSGQVILLGRSALNANKEEQLKSLNRGKVQVAYKQVDLTQGAKLKTVIEDVINQYGDINGVIHSAGLVRDNVILKKQAEDLKAVLTPKVTGLVNIDEVTKECNLDFLAVFSSIASINGNMGQSDYATANGFMDAYGTYRNNLVKAQKRSGQTYVFNWPLWKDGGMQIPDAIVTTLKDSYGMAPLTNKSGIKAFYDVIAAKIPQALVIEGNDTKVEEKLIAQLNQVASNITKETISKPKVQEIRIERNEKLKRKAVNYIKELVSDVLKLAASKIDASAPLEDYGIDSVMIMDLTSQLEKVFGELPKTLFFEYQTIDALTEYFLQNYRDQLYEILSINEVIEEVAVSEEVRADEVEEADDYRIGLNSRLIKATSTSQDEESLDMAIIGISGRYPSARNVNELWEALKAGKDCVTEIPKERWDYRKYYDKNRNVPGKVCTKWGGFIDDVDMFDPLFFNISPREAEIMDHKKDYSYSVLMKQCKMQDIQKKN